MTVTAAELQVILSARDQASGVVKGLARELGGLGTKASALGGQMKAVGTGVLAMGGIMAGVATGGAAALTGAFGILAAAGKDAVSEYEQMGFAFESLVAREMSRGKVVEQTRTAALQLTADEREELVDLTGEITKQELAQATLSARIEEQKQQVWEMTNRWSEQGLATQTARAELAQMENQFATAGAELEQMRGRVGELNAKDGQMATVIEKVRVGQMSMNEALAQAGPRAQELLQWTQKLAIQSPFDQEGVAKAFKTALAYGFASDEAQRMTGAMIDFAAGTGQTTDTMDRIALALGQIRAKGKVAGQEVMQLTESGIAVDEILADAFGKSTAEIVDMREKGLIPADEAIEAIVSSLERDFGGAAKRQTNSISGLFNSLEDIKKIGLREFFTSTFEAIKGPLSGVVDTVTNDPERIFAPIRRAGDQIGATIGTVIGRIGELQGAFSSGGIAGLAEALGVSPEMSALIRTALSDLGSLAGQVRGGIGAALAWVGNTIMPKLNAALGWVNENWEAFKGAIAGVGAVLAASAIVAILSGVGAVLGMLLSPLGLVMIAAAALGAAWNSNFMGIRDTLTEVWTNTLQPALVSMGEWLQTNLPVALEALRAAWEERLLPAVQTAAAFLQTNVPIALAAVSDFWTGTLQPALTAMVGWFQNDLPAAVAALEAFFAPTWERLRAGVGGFAEALGPVIPAIQGLWAQIQALLPASDGAGASLAGLAGLLGGALLGALQIIGETLAFLLPYVGEMITNAVVFATATLGGLITFISGAVQMIVGLFTGDMDQARAGAELVLTGIKQVFEAQLQFISSTVGTYLSLVLGLFETMGVDVSDTVEGMIGAVVSFFVDTDWAGLGEGIVEGLIKGVGDVKDRFIQAITGMAQAAIDAAKQILGIQSPSTEFAEIAEETGAGFIQGLQGVTGAVVAQTAQLATAVVDKFSAVGSRIASAVLGGISSMAAFDTGDVWSGVIRRNLSDAYTALNDAPRFSPKISTNAKWLDFVDDLGYKRYWQQAWDSLAPSMSLDTTMGDVYRQVLDRTGELAGDSWSGAFQAVNRYMYGAIEDQIAGIADMTLGQYAGLVDARIEEMFGVASVLGSVGSAAMSMLQSRGIDPMNDQIAALEEQLELLQQQGATLEEQEAVTAQIAAEREKVAAAEAAIAELQSQQQNLQFLQQQANLLSVISDYGLNAADILGGMELGIGADLQGLVEAMSRAMQSVIAQAEEELGIASPSRVFARMGRQSMEGYARGLGLGASGAQAEVRDVSRGMGQAAGKSLVQKFYLTANYPYQREESLRTDVKLLQMLARGA